MKANPKVVIIDYACGNLYSIQRALRQAGVSSRISSVPEEILKADKIILPGVGAFGDGMKKLISYELFDVITQCASAGKFILGICLGMQLLFEESFEFGHHQGLKLISGKVTRLCEDGAQGGSIKVPHVGWNAIRFLDNADSPNVFFCGVTNGAYMYFLHSFCVKADGAKEHLALTAYGTNTFCAMVQKENIIGVQFHPEISGSLGLTLLKNFVFKL